MPAWLRFAEEIGLLLVSSFPFNKGFAVFLLVPMFEVIKFKTIANSSCILYSRVTLFTLCKNCNFNLSLRMFHFLQ